MSFIPVIHRFLNIKLTKTDQSIWKMRLGGSLNIEMCQIVLPLHEINQCRHPSGRREQKRPDVK